MHEIQQDNCGSSQEKSVKKGESDDEEVRRSMQLWSGELGRSRVGPPPRVTYPAHQQWVQVMSRLAVAGTDARSMRGHTMSGGGGGQELTWWGQTSGGGRGSEVYSVGG